MKKKNSILKGRKLNILPTLLICNILIFYTCCNIGRHNNNSISLVKANDTVLNYSRYSTKIYGAEPNPTGEPIGGGLGYSKIITSYTYLVRTKEELLSTLKKAKSRDIIYITDTSRINLSGCPVIKIPEGVTLASGRGKDNSEGALLFSNELKTFPMFETGGEYVHVTGLRFSGPDTTRRTEQMKELYKEGKYYSIPNSRGIQSSYSHSEIDNCEFWGWSDAAIYLILNKKLIKCDSNYVHNNYFHHCQREGLGYGVCLDNAQALIEANIFDCCRHGIAGTGRTNTSYEARFNLVLEHFNSHAFDMHGGADRKDSTNIAGNTIRIHHNTFKLINQSDVVIRGIPVIGAEIYNNYFYNKDSTKSVLQINAHGNFKMYNNKFGVK